MLCDKQSKQKKMSNYKQQTNQEQIVNIRLANTDQTTKEMSKQKQTKSRCLSNTKQMRSKQQIKTK